jgi:hypothetical protein
MTNKRPPTLHRSIIAAILSLFLCGLGHIYLHRIVKALILILSCCFAIAVIWIAITNTEFKILTWGEKEVVFSPARRIISLSGYTIHMADIMKVTGTLQLAFTWIFGIIDAWREGRRYI